MPPPLTRPLHRWQQRRFIQQIQTSFRFGFRNPTTGLVTILTQRTLQQLQQLHHHQHPITSILLFSSTAASDAASHYLLSGDESGLVAVCYSSSDSRLDSHLHDEFLWRLDTVLQVSSFRVTALLPLPPGPPLLSSSPPRVFCSVLGPEYAPH